MFRGQKAVRRAYGKRTPSLDKNVDRKKDIDSSPSGPCLNDCELVAVAIQKTAMHEEMYKLSGCTPYVQIGALARDYVKQRRNAPGRKTL